jgi:hypothetical protein
MNEERVVLNGINALTCKYLVPPMTVAEAAARARETPALPELAQLPDRMVEEFQGVATFHPPMDIDPTDLAQAGWAMVFTPDTPPAVRQALQPLLDLRNRQVPPEAFKVLEYRRGETRESWLGKYKSHNKGVEPIRVPHLGAPQSLSGARKLDEAFDPNWP